MNAPAPLDLVLVGPPRLDGGGLRAAQWRRALARRELAGAAAAVVIGPLTAGARAVEAEGLRPALGGLGARAVVLPGPGDMPSQGKPPGWLLGAAGATSLPRRIALGDRRTTLIPLDTLRLDGGRDAIGASQLATLEGWLAERRPDERTVLALAHDPRGKPEDGPALLDAKALEALLKRHPVALVVHGQRAGLVRGRFAGVPTVSPPPLDGCRITGWRALVRVRFGEGPAPEVAPVHFARPEDRPALAEAFAAAEVAGAWTALAEKIVAADDTFAALAAEMQARAVRLDALAEHGAALDDALAALIRRAGSEGGPR